MRNIAIVYHSGQGNTERLARQVAVGAGRIDGVTVEVIPAQELTADPERLLAFDGFIWGSPTYLGGVSGTFKSFMDATGGLWRTQKLKGKIAAGFTVSSLPSGDKQTTLISMLTFSMQHGMIWVGNPFLPERREGVAYEQSLNRLGSWTGLMAQGGHSAANTSMAEGDLKTAEAFGANFATVLTRVETEAEEVV